MHTMMIRQSVDRIALGRAILDYTQMTLERADRFAKKNEDKVKIINIKFKDLIKNPKEVCRLVLNHIDFPFSQDFEDAVQVFTALNGKIDYLITRNIKDFKLSPIPALTADQFLQLNNHSSK